MVSGTPSVMRKAEELSTVVQPCSAPLQTSFDRTQRPAQLPGRFLQAAALQAAQDHREAVDLRQPRQLLVEDLEQLAGTQLVQRVG